MRIASNTASFQSKIFTQLEHVKVWVYNHPTTVKVARVAGLILGAGMLASLPFSAPTLGVGVVVTLAITGVLLTLASSVALVALDIFVPPHHDMKHHAYKLGQCDGGRLYYEGDVPILSLHSDDPFKAGKAQGYLCGDAINRLTKRFSFVFHTLLRRQRADKLPNALETIRQGIPPHILREMEGLVEGYNQWAKEQHWWKFPKKMTLDEALLFHLMPDSCHFNPEVLEHRSCDPRKELAIACSAIVDRDPQKRFVFARNMDWPSLGLAGKYSLVLHRNHTNGLQSTIEVGIPGFVGTFTGMNSNGLSLAMNVCSGNITKAGGMPACLYNRTCLEQCQNIEEVERFVKDNSPLGEYHLTVADREGGKSFHFYQSGSLTHPIRSWKEGNPLITLNYRYSPTPYCPMHFSNERQRVLNSFFRNKGNNRLEDALALPPVNNWETTHRVVMEPATGTFKVAFDNAFAGNAPLHSVSTQTLFAHR